MAQLPRASRQWPYKTEAGICLYCHPSPARLPHYNSHAVFEYSVKRDRVGSLPCTTCACIVRKASNLVFSRGSDFGVEFRAGVQVMVVSREAGSAQFLCLLWREHAQSGADFHAQVSDTFDHIQNTLPLPGPHLRWTPPSSTHAEPRASCRFGSQGCL